MRFVIALDTALRLVDERAAIAPDKSLLAPTLLRSQILTSLYADARAGRIDRAEARARLDHMRSLKIRLLGDRVLQAAAWDVAEHFGWADTLLAEYVALTPLQADAFVTLDRDLNRTLAGFVPLATFDELLA